MLGSLLPLERFWQRLAPRSPYFLADFSPRFSRAEAQDDLVRFDQTADRHYCFVSNASPNRLIVHNAGALPTISCPRSAGRTAMLTSSSTVWMSAKQK